MEKSHCHVKDVEGTVSTPQLAKLQCMHMLATKYWHATVTYIPPRKK